VITVKLTLLATVESFEKPMVDRSQRLLVFVVVFEVSPKLTHCKYSDQRIFVVEVISDESVVRAGFRFICVTAYKVFFLKV
jgi:hypothetical protein